jgi:hypothetical protein
MPPIELRYDEFLSLWIVWLWYQCFESQRRRLFAVVPANRLHNDSSVSLHQIANALKQRFWATSVNIQSPAVVIPFGTDKSESHEIIPAYLEQTVGVVSVYGIPNRQNGWMRSAPIAYGEYIDTIHTRLVNRVKPLIRLEPISKFQTAVDPL